jgi:hypothetical protein
MSLEGALDLIHRFLTGLKHSGAGGFEGLVAILCDSATGQRFRISGSGPQEGQDVRSEPGIGNLIKVEAKHYHKGKLSLRELEGELAQAALAGSGLDLWVLAASCQINDEHAKKLEADARELNVEVLFLDMGNEGLPRLAVLMASFPEAVERWIGLHAITEPLEPLKAAFATLRSDPQFGRVVEQLSGKLKNTLLGYEDARQRAMRRFLSVMADRGDCVARFNQDVALRAQGARSIDRTSINNAFNAWWNSGAPPRKRAVVLGEEGTGKTWAAMGWALSMGETNAMPLFAPFNAHVAAIGENESLETFLPKLLADWTEIGTAESWAGRLRRWLALPAEKPIVVVLADGLNERPNVNWPTFFRTLEDSRWRDSVCLIASDRPGHWHPNCAMSGLPGFQEIQIAGYTDSELRRALEGTGVELSRIPEQLQSLIRKPRYCKLVASHFDEMEREGDTSVERLIFLDSKHRCEEKRGHPLNTTQFNDLIRALAASYRERPQLTRRDIEDLLPGRDPDGRIYQEIIDGGMLVARGAQSTFTVERTRLIYGLGMLLAEDISAACLRLSDRELQERIASWFEPHPEMELKIQICGSALFHALIDDQYPAIARRELLRYWLGLRNWLDEWHDAPLQFFVRCPDDFIAIVESFWRSSHDRGAAQDLLGRAFTKYRDDARVQASLIAAVEQWMSVVNRCGPPILRHDEARTTKLREDIAARLGGDFKPGTQVTVAGESLLVIDDDGLSRLARLGLLIISAGVRAPYARALTRWALAGAVMGTALGYDEAAWVCRLADDDIETPLLTYASNLLALDTSIAHTAAHTLLECLGTTRAEGLRNAHPLPESEFARKRREAREADPCVIWEAWTDEDCQRCIERTDIRPGIVVGKLGLRLMNPDYPIGSVLVPRARALMSAINPETLRSQMGRTAEDHTLEELWPLLASRAPEALADYLRGVVRTLPARSQLGKRQLAFWLDEFTILLERDEADIILKEISALHTELKASGGAENGHSETQTIEEFLFFAVLPHLPIEQRLRLLLARPATAGDLMDLQLWFEPLPSIAFRNALNSLHSMTDLRAIFRTLWFLGTTCEPLSDHDRDLFVSFMSREDPLIRGACMRFACMSGDDTLGRRIVDLGTSYVGAAPSWESHWGNQLICLFSAHLPFEVAASRVHPAIAGYLLEARSNRPAEVELYAETLHHGWQKIISATDPNLAGLPIVIAKKRRPRLESDLPEFRDEEPRQLKFKNWTTSWTSGQPSEKSIADAFAALQEDPTPRLNQRAREQVEALTAAWTTPALEWFGRDFSRGALRAIHERVPEFLERWIEPALATGPDGRTVRLRLGSFLVDVCAVLLERDSARGLQIWEALRREHNVPVQFNTTEEAFLAPKGRDGDLARDQELAECSDDLDLCNLARLAEAEDRTEWLNGAIQKLVADPALWRRAKGLTVASFSNISTAAFDKLVAQAHIADTWIERAVNTMRNNVQANELAQRWYRTYFMEPNIDKAWGAYQMMLECGDERFHTWRGRIETEGVDVDRKRRFVGASWQSTKRALNRENKRKDHLFGYKIPRGEIFPFVRF